MKAWARKFYHSKEWLRIRKLAIIRADGLCERCESPGYIVHHMEELTAENVNDPEIALNLDNLEYVCKACHDQEHEFGQKRSTVDGLRFDADGNIINTKKRKDVT